MQQIITNLKGLLFNTQFHRNELCSSYSNNDKLFKLSAYTYSLSEHGVPYVLRMWNGKT